MLFAPIAVGVLLTAVVCRAAEIPGCPDAPPDMNLVGLGDWDSKFHLIRSSADGSEQPLYAVFPEGEEPVPLLVGLHSWSLSCRASIPAVGMRAYCETNGWAFVYPNCRGPNNRPEACGSDLAVADMMDAIAWAKTQRAIDASRIYLIGSSGGGYLSLLVAARHPETFAAVAAFCPITDLARWHTESRRLEQGYYRMLEACCGGTPDTCAAEYAARSPVWFLPNARKDGPVFYIAAGIHDGHRTQTVPAGHSVRAFNALAEAKDRFTDAQIAAIEAREAAPYGLEFKGVDPLYPPEHRVHLRRTSGRVRLTLFEGGHNTVAPAGYDFVRRQRRGQAPDWTLPEASAPAGMDTGSTAGTPSLRRAGTAEAITR